MIYEHGFLIQPMNAKEEEKMYLYNPQITESKILQCIAIQ